MDDIDFLGYIVRPDYLLVRRRVVGALRDRLKRAEQSLAGVGMALDAHGRSLFPWHRRAVDETLQWLNSYLAHMKRASSHRLVKTLRDRFWWLEAYFVWDGSKVSLRYPIPRFTLRSWQQRRWFRDRFPGHVLMIQKGGFWEMDVLSRGTGLCLAQWPKRIHRRGLAGVKAALWEAKVPVAWIGETGRRVSAISERALMYHWAFQCDVTG